MKTPLKKKLVSDTLYMFLDSFFVSFFSFLFWFILAKTVLPDVYGIVTVSLNLIILLSSISLIGLDGPIAKLIPEFIQKKNYVAITQLIKLSFKVILSSNLLILFILLLFPNQISSLLNIRSTIIVYLGFGVLLHSIMITFLQIHYGFRKMKKFFISNFLGQMSKVLFTLIIVYLGYSYFGILVGYSLSLLVIIFISFDRTWFHKTKYKLDEKHVMTFYALPAFFGAVAIMLYVKGPQIVLNIFNDQISTGLFSIAMTIVTPLGMIGSTLSKVLFPTASGLSVTKEKTKIPSIIIAAIRYTFFICLPIIIILSPPFSNYIILLFSTVEYLAAAPFLLILAISSTLFGLSNIFSMSLYAVGYTKPPRNSKLLTCITFLLFSIPLTYYFSAWGMCITILISSLVFFLSSLLFLKDKVKLKLPYINFLKLFLACLVFISFMYVFSLFTSGILVNILIAIIGVFIYLMSLWFLKFYSCYDFEIAENLVNRIPIFKTMLLKILKKIKRKYKV